MNTIKIQISELQSVTSKDSVRNALIDYLTSFNDDNICRELSLLVYDSIGIPSLNSFVSSYTSFVTRYPEISKKLFVLSDKGGGYGGPGEVLSYFAIDDVKLGGPASRCDILWLDDSPVAELKGVKVLSDGAVTQFQLGIAAQPAVLDYCRDVIKFLDRYCIEYGEYPRHARGHWLPSNPTEVAPSILQMLRDKDIKLHTVTDDIGYHLEDLCLHTDGRLSIGSDVLGNMLSNPAHLYESLINHVKCSTPNTIHDIDLKFENFIKTSSLGEKPFAFLCTKTTNIVAHGYLKNAVYIKPYQLTQRSIKPMIKF